MRSDQRNVVLSPRQDELLRAIAQGKSQKEIALEWGVTHTTVASCAMHLRRKLGVRTMRELIAYVAAPMNTSAELARLRSEVAGLEAWRRTMNKEINLVTAQRDALLKELEDLRPQNRLLDKLPDHGHD